MVRALWPVNASPDWKLPTVSEMEPLMRQRSLIYAPLCQEGEKWPSWCRPRLFYSQPRQLPCARHPCWNPPTSPYPTFFASTKPIFKRDCAYWWHAAKVAWWAHSSSVVKGLRKPLNSLIERLCSPLRLSFMGSFKTQRVIVSGRADNCSCVARTCQVSLKQSHLVDYEGNIVLWSCRLCSCELERSCVLVLVQYWHCYKF